jgi:hypothetical protein
MYSPVATAFPTADEQERDPGGKLTRLRKNHQCCVGRQADERDVADRAEAAAAVAGAVAGTDARKGGP